MRKLPLFEMSTKDWRYEAVSTYLDSENANIKEAYSKLFPNGKSVTTDDMKNEIIIAMRDAGYKDMVEIAGLILPDTYNESLKDDDKWERIKQEIGNDTFLDELLRRIPSDVLSPILDSIETDYSLNRDAHEEGYQAYQSMSGLEDNPYEKGTSEYEDWAEGWNTGDAEYNIDDDIDEHGIEMYGELAMGAFEEGRKAYQEGKSVIDNPYESGSTTLKARWKQGWYDAKSDTDTTAYGEKILNDIDFDDED